MTTKQIKDFPTPPQALADSDIVAAEQEVSGVWTTCKITLLALYTYVLGKLNTAGRIIPAGGTTDQLLGKTSNTDYAVSWRTVYGLPTPNGSLDDDKFVKYDGGGTWSYAFPPDQSAGSVSQIQVKASGGGFAGASKAEIDANGSLRLVVDATPATPAVDKVAFPAIKIGGRPVLAQLAAYGGIVTPSLAWATSKIGVWASQGNAAVAPAALGIPAATAIGANGSRDVTAGSTTLAGLRRAYNASAGTAGSSCGWRVAALQFYRSTAADGTGGFFLAFRFGEEIAPADGRMFVGLYGTNAAIGNVNPSTLLNIIGVGYDSGETSWSIMHNDGSGTATKTSLGSNFPCNSTSDAYDLYIWAPSGQESVWVEVVRLGTAHKTTLEITADLPALNTLLAPQVWANNGTTAGAKGISLSHMYTEVDL